MRHVMQELRSLPQAVRGLLIVTAVSRLGSNLNAFLILYLTQVFGLTVGEAGRYMMAYGLGGLVATLLGGMAVDRWGSRRVILFSFLGTLATLAGFMVVDRVLWILPAIAACSLCIEVIRPASTTLIAQTVHGPMSIKAYSLHHMMINLGVMVGPLFGSMLVEWGFGWLFGWQLVTTAVALLITARMIVEAPRLTAVPTADRPAPDTVPAAPALEPPWQVTPYLLALALSFCFVFLIMPPAVILPAYVRDVLHGPTWHFGAAMSLNAAGVLLLAYPLAGWTSRFHPFLAAGVGVCLFGLGDALIAGVSGLAGLLMATVVFTVGEAASVAVIQNLIARLTPAARRGRLFGLAQAVSAVGAMLVPAVSGLVIDHWGFRPYWLGLGSIGLVALLVGWIGYRATGHLATTPATAPSATAAEA